MPIQVEKVVTGGDEAVSMPGDAMNKQRPEALSSCDSRCDCRNHPHDPADNNDRTNRHRLSWLSSRLGQATSKGLGGGLISAIIFMPCPCCGGLILACLRGLLSAAIGLIVGIVAYRRQPGPATANRNVVSPDAASQPK